MIPNDFDVEHFVKAELEYEINKKKEEDELNSFLTNSGISDIEKFYTGLQKLGYFIS